ERGLYARIRRFMVAPAAAGKRVPWAQNATLYEQGVRSRSKLARPSAAVAASASGADARSRAQPPGPRREARDPNRVAGHVRGALSRGPEVVMLGIVRRIFAPVAVAFLLYFAWDARESLIETLRGG